MSVQEPDVRLEHDALGTVEVPARRCCGAQTQRSLMNFAIGTERMPEEIIRAFALLKKAAALTNRELAVWTGTGAAGSPPPAMKYWITGGTMSFP